MIRSAAAQDIVAFLGILEPKNWPECLMLLVNQLDDQDHVHQEVCPPISIVTLVFSSATGRRPHSSLSFSFHGTQIPLALPGHKWGRCTPAALEITLCA